MSEGNYEVILCERGVRTFADHARNTLDLSIVPALQHVSHLPILVDPSHGTGRRDRENVELGRGERDKAPKASTRGSRAGRIEIRCVNGRGSQSRARTRRWRAEGADPLGGRRMIGPGSNARVYLACGAVDMRKGIDGLAALAQASLRQNPASGAVFAFRGRRGDRLKLLFWDGQGFCLFYKVLERGRFPWPSAADGAARLTAAQLAMLWEGIDWRRPSWSSPPSRTA